MDPLGLGDPAVRRAYLLTKAAVVALAGGVTALLAPRFGPRLWWAWAAFAGVMVVLAAIVLALGGRSGGAGASGTGEIAPCEPEPVAGPDEPVTLPVEDWIDLHPFDPAEIPSVVDEYLRAAAGAGFTEVRIVHGKGIGVQRDRVRRVLEDHPLVRRYAEAPPERGGWGATLAWLETGGGETAGAT